MVDVPATALREPAVRLAETLQVSDREMARILRDAADESARIIERYGSTFSSRVRQAQLGLATVQRELWATVHNQVKVNIGDGADAAAASASYLDELMLNQVGMTTSWWRHSQLATARAGIASLISRKENGVDLSQRVYKNSVASGQRLDRMVNGMVLSGASAREIATRARDFIRPDVPGGVSYAAMRLGRTELNNAFHQTSKRMAADKPWVLGQKWNLSRSHPKPDECDEYATADNGLGEGVWDKGSVPDKPHPQCFCFLTTVTPDREAFIQAFANGQYDDYLGGMGCGVA